jgi:hypothetical protein
MFVVVKTHLEKLGHDSEHSGISKNLISVSMVY